VNAFAGARPGLETERLARIPGRIRPRHRHLRIDRPGPCRKDPRFRARAKAASALPDVGARELAPGPVCSRVSFGLAHGSPVQTEQIENIIQKVKGGWGKILRSTSEANSLRTTCYPKERCARRWILYEMR